ncbi:MAG: type II secretion system F family protein [Marinobacter sp.]|nr:type II secretion system F family protein [Marinobacter sp.]
MSGHGWLLLALVVALSALLLIAVEFLGGQWLERNRLLQRIRSRLKPEQAASHHEDGSARVLLGPLEAQLTKANIRLRPMMVVAVSLVVLILLLMIVANRGWLVAGVSALAMLGAALAYWNHRFQQMRRLVFSELPGIMESVLRFMAAGRSLEQSLVEAFGEAPAVFDPLTFRLRSAIEAGRDYTLLFEDFATLYKVPPLVLVSIALGTTNRFGASVRPVLQQVAENLRAQEALRQEFMAATAETRFTAVVFALLPPALAVFLILMNEDFSRVLLETSAGHNLLIIAACLQLAGMGIVWRMIQGVGRG